MRRNLLSETPCDRLADFMCEIGDDCAAYRDLAATADADTRDQCAADLYDYRVRARSETRFTGLERNRRRIGGGRARGGSAVAGPYLDGIPPVARAMSVTYDGKPIAYVAGIPLWIGI